MSEPNEYRASRAVEREVDYDAWFTSEVERGLAAADRGELTDREAVRVMVDSRYPDEALKARNISA